MDHQQFGLTWSTFNSCVRAGFQNFFDDKHFSDLTLVTEDGKYIKAHKVLVSLSSSTLRCILQNTDHPHPVVFLSGINHSTLLSIIKFIYLGETTVTQESFPLFMEASLKLKIAGLEEILSLGNTTTDQTLLSKNDMKTDIEETNDAGDNTSLPVFSQNNSFEKLESVFEPEHYVPSPLRFKTPRKHSETNKPFLCSKCNKTFTDKITLVKHKRSVHEKEIFTCSECGYKSNKQIGLMKHVKSVHSSRN